MTTPTAPPQTPAAQAESKTTLATVAHGMAITAVAGREDLERIEAVVNLPADYQYAIPIKGVKNPDGSWNNSLQKVGISADGYDYINRALGCSFFLPEWVHDEHGNRQRNPIHRKDYIYLRMAAVWYTPLGQLVMAGEDVEVDYNLTWMDARINSTGAVVVVDEATGLPVFDRFGNPALKISPESELKALKTLSQLRSFGPRYAQTVARVRLLKMATGLRSLPLDRPTDIALKITGYRDRLTPQERIEKAKAGTEAMYGRPAEVKPLSAAELDEVGGDVVDTTAVEQIDQSRVNAGEQVDEDKNLPDIPETTGQQAAAPWAETDAEQAEPAVAPA